ncbi:hypothetical protein BDB00DRAFT_817142 [Zychaea mexicana]|uniref:uncharacterized protein n=1 Tax=Zychaea mexicana TaxID=64656 RepID=UPI0022FDF70E|nr:uncharacterized protein BDB00DRAFT_817142 [Zychaea mexicana]KAI9494799.1 hypothetical protein BDB00DRAFT_817142 [Zychaea mexicana]
MGDRMAIDEEAPVRKGRGFTSNDESSRASRDARMDVSNGVTPERSIEGWIIIVRGVHPEADEESLTERFAEYGTIKNLHLNLDRRTGFVKGYALVEYETLKEAQSAINDANGTTFYDQTLKVDFAFSKSSEETRGSRRTNDRRGRDRSLSPLDYDNGR